MSDTPDITGWWAVYHGAEKIDAGDRKIVAVFLHKHQAEVFASIYGGYAEVVQL